MNKIQFSKYEQLLKIDANYCEQLLFVPTHLQTLFGFSSTVSTKSNWKFILTREMCMYLHLDECFKDVSYNELITIIKYFNDTKDTYENEGYGYIKPFKKEYLASMSKKHPALSNTLNEVLENNSEAIKMFSNKITGFDEMQLIKEMYTPEFLTSSDEEGGGGGGEQCHIVKVRQGCCSDSEAQNIITFKNLKRARKFTKRLNKVKYTHNPADDIHILRDKLLAIHPKSWNIYQDDLPRYYIDSTDFIDN